MPIQTQKEEETSKLISANKKAEEDNKTAIKNICELLEKKRPCNKKKNEYNNIEICVWNDSTKPKCQPKYQQKYLKYKQKYLLLKQHMNGISH